MSQTDVKVARPSKASWWSQRSLKLKLTAIALSSVGILLFVFVNGTVVFFRSFIQQNSDSMLITSATTLAGESPLTVRERFMSGNIDLPPLPSDYYIAFLDPQGGLYLGLVSSAVNERPVPNLSQFNVISVQATGGLPFTADIARGSDSPPQEWRLVALPLRDLAGSVVVGIPETHNQALLNQFRAIGFGLSGLLLVIVGTALWLSINSALKPLREVSIAAEKVRNGKFNERLPQRDGDTEVAVLNRSLNEMLDSVEGSIKSRNQTVDRMKQFIGDASHELRTPLVTLRGYAELYRKGAFKEKSQVDDAMEKIESEAIRMSNLVESLLALARLDNEAGLNISKVDVSQVISSVIDNIKAAYPNTVISKVGLNDGKAAEKLIWHLDEGAIRQVLTNLINNARTFAGEKPIEVAFGTKEHRLVVEVIDHGAGIPKQLRSKVFERFYRSDNSRNRDIGGSGLGLAIVKGLVDRHGGKITADETKGGGATFRISLPNSQPS